MALVLMVCLACTGQSAITAKGCAFQDHAGGVQRALRLTPSGSAKLVVKVGTGITVDFASERQVQNVSLTPGSAVLAPGTQNGLRGQEYLFTVINPGKVVVSATTTSGHVSATVVASC
ncbi:MAG: hypothetical protein JWL79_2105 [Frankiales bacterium]|nr:hypothetical protein [Frankiales bacterium]